MRAPLRLWTPSAPKRRRLVLIGGGHTHVQVLRHLMMERAELRDDANDPASDESSVWSPETLDVTVVVDDPVAVYSGMVPGFVAGQYQHRELEIDVVPLAMLAQARPIVARATSVDPENRLVELEGRAPIRYDLLSIDIGSTVFGLDLPGVREYALASRPISSLVQRTENEIAVAIERASASQRPVQIAVVGAGAGGVELAFTVRERILSTLQRGSTHRADGISTGDTGDTSHPANPQITLIHAGPEILPGASKAMVEKVKTAAHSRQIEIRTGRRVEAIQRESATGRRTVKLAHPNDKKESDQDTALEVDAVIWVAGAKPHGNFDASKLSTNDQGFLSTENTLQVVGEERVFAVGDCATLRHTPNPKAGVYAVRQGPFLIDNIERSLQNEPLRRYEPQSDFLALLNLGDGTAIGSKWGLAFEGRWVMKLKDWIDRRFMEKFQVLEGSGQYTAPFSEHAEAMHDEENEMACGGCAAKLEQSSLRAALARSWDDNQPEGPSVAKGDQTDAVIDDNAPRAILGVDDKDDIAAWQTPKGETVVRSVDAFRAFADDPWLVGRVALENAVSDLFAKGSRPSFALSLVGLPQDLPPSHSEDMLLQVLAGAKTAMAANDVQLLGGHTTIGQELWVGFSVDGVEANPDGLLSKGPPAVGHQLILTKPLGSGVLLHAHMMGLLSGPDYVGLTTTLLQGNGAAGKIARQFAERHHEAVSACTDVTGFGLFGHLLEMLEAEEKCPSPTIGATLHLDAVPLYDGAHACMEAGLRSTAHRANSYRAQELKATGWSDDQVDVLFDPQTSGGLLLAVAPDRVKAVLDRLRESGYDAANTIGTIDEHSDSAEPRVRLAPHSSRGRNE